MYCPKCYRMVDDDSDFCPKCGEPLKKKKSPRKTSVLMYILLFILGVCFIVDGVHDLLSLSGSSSSSTTLSESDYKSMCDVISYEDLARNPSSKKGNYYTFKGEVIQVIENGKSIELRMNVTPVMFYDEVSYYEDTIYVTTKLGSDGQRILEGDIIQIYGKCTGLYSYRSVLGQKISIPGMDAAYWAIVE